MTSLMYTAHFDLDRLGSFGRVGDHCRSHMFGVLFEFPHFRMQRHTGPTFPTPPTVDMLVGYSCCYCCCCCYCCYSDLKQNNVDMYCTTKKSNPPHLYRNIACGGLLAIPCSEDVSNKKITFYVCMVLVRVQISGLHMIPSLLEGAGISEEAGV